MTTNQPNSLSEMFASKYAQAVANGATDEQAIHACRLLWLAALDIDPRKVWSR